MSRRKDSKLSISAEDGDSVGIDVDQAAKMEEPLDFPKPCVRVAASQHLKLAFILKRPI